MREAAGQTLKSSVSHTWTRDTRDDKFTATRGLYTKLFQEFAGLGGDASFYKTEAEGQLSRPLVPGVVRSLLVLFMRISLRNEVYSMSDRPCLLLHVQVFFGALGILVSFLIDFSSGVQLVFDRSGQTAWAPGMAVSDNKSVYQDKLIKSNS